MHENDEKGEVQGCS